MENFRGELNMKERKVTLKMRPIFVIQFDERKSMPKTKFSTCIVEYNSILNFARLHYIAICQYGTLLIVLSPAFYLFLSLSLSCILFLAQTLYLFVVGFTVHFLQHNESRKENNELNEFRGDKIGWAQTNAQQR